MRVYFKELLGALLMGLVLAGFWQGEAKAAELDVSKCIMDYETQSLYIPYSDSGTEQEIQVSYPVLTLGTDKKPYLKFKSWDIYTTQDVVEEPRYDEDDAWNGSLGSFWIINFSHLKSTQEQYIALKGDKSSDIILLHLDSTIQLKPKYNALTGAMQMGVEDSGQNFQYCTQGGQWESYDTATMDWTKYANQGAVLYLRQAPSYEDDTFFERAYAAQNKSSNVIDSSKYMGYTCYDLGHFAGLEKKVKIPSLSAGPTVKIDYDKRQFTFKKGSYYRFSTDDSWTKNLQLTSVTLPADGAAGAIYLQTAATEKKQASKVVRYAYPAVRVVLTEEDAVGGVVENKTVSADGETELDVTSRLDKKGKVLGITITNSSAKDYQYVLSATEIKDVSDIPQNKQYKAKKVAAAKSSGATKSNVSATNSQNMYLYVRYAQTKATKTTEAQWSSDYVCLGKVDLTTEK